jgi:serine phosphatase RsbU (regulator of sigma subunit)
MMPNKKIAHILIILSLLISSVHAQEYFYGLPNIKNYHFAEMGGSEQNWCITKDHRGVIYVGNNDQGILEFDGSDWRTIPVPGNNTVRSIITGDDGVVYAGLEGDLGRLEPDQRGTLHFRSLLDTDARERYPAVRIWKTYYQDGKVYFCSTKAIFVFDPVSQGLSFINTPPYAFLSFIIPSGIYTGDYESGLMKYQDGQYVPVPGGEFFRKKNVSGLVALDSSHLLASTIFNGLFLIDIEKGTIDSTYLKPTLKVDLASDMILNLNKDDIHIYIGTRDEGLIVLNYAGELSEIISTNEGILDNTITQVYVDPQGTVDNTLWLSNFKGVSKIDLNSPFRMQTVGPRPVGIDGRGSMEQITDITEFGDELFVSTLGGILHRPFHSERSRFRNIRGLRDEIYDLQLVQPADGKKYLLAASTDKTYVIDQDMKVTALPVGGRKILTDPGNPDVFYTGRSNLTGFQYINGGWKEFLNEVLDSDIYQLCLDRFENIWVSTWTGLLRLNRTSGKVIEITRFEIEQGLPGVRNLGLFIDPANRELLASTENGFYRFDYRNQTFLYDSVYNSILPDGKNNIMAVQKGSDDLYWFSFENEFRGWSILGASKQSGVFETVYDRTFRALSSRIPTEVFYTDSEDQLWFNKSNQLIHFNAKLAKETEDNFNLLIRRVSITGDSVLFNGSFYTIDDSGQILPHDEQTENSQPKLKHIYRDIEFNWSAPYYKQEYQIRYSYNLEGLSSKWSDWSRDRSVIINNLKHGRYVMQVKARNAYGEESQKASYAFTIMRPWYFTVVAIITYVILLASLAIFIIIYTRNLKSRNELLERQNREIEKQKGELQHLNEEITAQRDEIEAQRDSISEQKELIDRQKNAMIDSIYYARRIQDAVLPAEEVMRFLLPKHFVYYRPRDIVSGDFYWVDKRDETVLIAVADCTGHGVPGAFMSMLGISLLNEISSKYRDQSTNEMMDELRDQVIAALGQTGDKYEAKDGIEMGLVAINTNTREIEFTGANLHLYTFQDGKLVVVKGDHMPVGIHSASSTLFKAHKLKLKRGDSLYMFSDGYVDQFGGDERKKFGTSRIKRLLTEIQQNIMHDQKETLQKEFETWKGDEDQIDDVLMIGIKL